VPSEMFGGETPVLALDCLGDTLLVRRNDLAEVFWVHPSGERCRADQIGEHDRDLAPLGAIFGRRPYGWSGLRVTGRPPSTRVVTQSSDCIEQLYPMPKCCDAKLLQVLFRQARKNRLVYLILAECRLILPEAKAPQPDYNVHDGAYNRGWRTSSAGPERLSRAFGLYVLLLAPPQAAAGGGLIYLPRGVREIAAAVNVPPMAIHRLHARGGTVNG
jgi:hypothetical protein